MSQLHARLNDAAHTAATGRNNMPEPTPAQRLAGNYLMGRFRLHGLDVRIENPEGTFREGTDTDGQPWRTRLAAHYGYFAGTRGADGDPVDVFIGVLPESQHVWVVNQVEPGTGAFDEHKVMLGFGTEDLARAGYLGSYTPGWKGLGSMVRITLAQLRWWLKSGDRTAPIRSAADLLSAPEPKKESSMKPVQWDNATNQPRGQTLGKVLYDIRLDDAGDDLMTDPMTMDDLLSDPDIDSLLVFDALVVEAGMLKTKTDQIFTVLKAAGKTVQPQQVEIGEPVRLKGTMQIPVIYGMSDGQTLAIWFHNPDTTPAKLAPMDVLVSARWVINKKDVTIVVAPEKGKDLSPRDVARRIMALVEKNSAAFQRVNSKAGERAAAIEGLQTEIAGLEQKLDGLKVRVERAQEVRASAAAKKRTTPEGDMAAAFDRLAELGWQKSNSFMTKDFIGVAEPGELSDGTRTVVIENRRKIIAAVMGETHLASELIYSGSGGASADRLDSRVEAIMAQRREEVAAIEAAKPSANVPPAAPTPAEPEWKTMQVPDIMTAEQYAVVYGVPAAEEHWQDVLDDQFGRRLTSTRNAARALGWDGERNQWPLTKGGAALNIDLRKAGTGGNIVGITYQVSVGGEGVAAIRDDLSKSPDELAAEIDARAPVRVSSEGSQPGAQVADPQAVTGADPVSATAAPMNVDAPAMTREQIMKRRRDQLADVVATGKENNGGVLLALRPMALQARRDELAKVEAELDAAARNDASIERNKSMLKLAREDLAKQVPGSAGWMRMFRSVNEIEALLRELGAPDDQAGVPAADQPAAASAPAAVAPAPLKPLPPRISIRVTQAIESLNDAKSRLDTARTGLDENPNIGGGGRYESEVWQKVQGQVAKANDDLQKLRELGNQNGQIASLEALINSLGGVPDVKPSEKALAWTTSPAPAPAAGLTAAQRKKISDEIARTEAMLAKEYKISTDLQKPVAIGWYESHIANLSDVLNGRMSLAEIDASEREKIEDWDTTRAVFEARAAGATGAEPAAAAPAPEQPSTQFQNYANWLRKQAAEGKAVPETFWQQVAMDERLNDGEADALKAEHAAPAAPPASDPITEPDAAINRALLAEFDGPFAKLGEDQIPPLPVGSQHLLGMYSEMKKKAMAGSARGVVALLEQQTASSGDRWGSALNITREILRAMSEKGADQSEPIEPAAADLFGEAPQAFQTQPVALTPEGAESKVKTAKGTEVLTGYSVIEADHLITSHNPSTGDANPAFPAELQPRDRGRDASIAWVKKTAQNLDPDLLGKSRRADSGAPIVGPDGVVESGNGRTMAVVLAYQTGKADDYRAWLEEEAGYFGLKPEKVKAMKRPVLVRIRTSKVDRAAFAIEANQSDTLAMTATEKAKSDARRMDDGMIALMTENGDLAAAENVPFLSAFLRTLGEAEAAQYSTSDGKPTSTLIARVQAAIFAKAYADDRLLELTADVAKPEIANIVKALNHAAPEFIQAAAMDPDATSAATGKLTDAVEKSLNQKAVDALLGASNVIRQAKDAGQSVEEFLQQSGLFGDIDPDMAAMAVFISKNNRSAKRMGEAFKAMATFIKGEIQRRQTGDMFGDNEPVAFADIVAAANRELERMYGPGVETIGLFDRPAQAEAPASDPAPAAEAPEPDAQEPEPEVDPVAAVNAAYTFDKATDDFKALLADSIDVTDYSEFATAKAIDQAVKAAGGTVSWSLVVGAILDSVAEMSDGWEMDEPSEYEGIFDSVSGGEPQGVIRKGAKILGRAVFGGDGKAMIYVGKAGSDRVLVDGRRAILGEEPQALVSALFSMAATPTEPKVRKVSKKDAAKAADQLEFVVNDLSGKTQRELVSGADIHRRRIGDAVAAVEALKPGWPADVTFPQSTIKAAQQWLTSIAAAEAKGDDLILGAGDVKTMAMNAGVPESLWPAILANPASTRTSGSIVVPSYRMGAIKAAISSAKAGPAAPVEPAAAPVDAPRNADAAFLRSVIDKTAPGLLDPATADEIEAIMGRHPDDAEIDTLAGQAIDAYMAAAMEATAGLN